MTELTGEAGSGKTQLCLSAAASAAALGHRVVYLDTGGGFSAKRIKEFHRGFVTADADSDEVEQHLSLTLDLITVLNVHDIMTLFKVLEELALGLAGTRVFRAMVDWRVTRTWWTSGGTWVCSWLTASRRCCRR